MSEIIANAVDLDSRVAAAKESNDEMERLIEDFKPFLRARVIRYCARPDEDRREKLLSTAMMAFYEAIKSYDAAKGHFFPFADKVVKRRLIDALRGVYRDEIETVSLDEENEDQQKAHSPAVIELSLRVYDEQRRREALADEIEQFKAELTTWGITMKDLSKNSPKHQRVRDSYQLAVSEIADNADIVQTIQLKRYYPVKKISEITGLPQKNIERARIFILASLIIKFGDYENLSDYVRDRRIQL